MRITSRLLAWAITQLLLTAGTNFANTVNVVNDGFGAYDAVTVWAGGQYGTDVAAGVFTLNKTGDSGIGSTWHNGSIAGFCVELNEAAPTETLRYAVGMPDDMVVSYTGETLGNTKATLPAGAVGPLLRSILVPERGLQRGQPQCGGLRGGGLGDRL